MIRTFDIFLASIGIIILSPIMVLIALACWAETGSALFFQTRVGRNLTNFSLIKFQTMWPGTENLASHLIPTDSITPIGKVLRHYKLDELPQLINVLKGDMSLVGPRPCLPNQINLIRARVKYNVFKIRPGITGLAQIRKIDMSTPDLLARIDSEMVEQFSYASYIRYIAFTILGKGRGDSSFRNR